MLSLGCTEHQLLGACWLTRSCARFQLLLERLQNETTRLPAVRAFTRIAQSPLPLDLSNVLEALLSELTSYLRKANRHLRQASLAAIEVRGALFCSIHPHVPASDPAVHVHGWFNSLVAAGGHGATGLCSDV